MMCVVAVMIPIALSDRSMLSAYDTGAFHPGPIQGRPLA